MREESEMIKAMKLALEALECINSPLHMTELRSVGRAIIALRAAIAEASMQRLTDVQQEIEAPRVNQCAEVCERAKLCAVCARGLEDVQQDPVAWADIEQGAISWMKGEYGPTWKPLYTHPPRREWVGLTDEEIKEIIGPWGDTPIKGYTRKLFDQIEDKLKEKNT